MLSSLGHVTAHAGGACTNGPRFHAFSRDVQGCDPSADRPNDHS